MVSAKRAADSHPNTCNLFLQQAKVDEEARLRRDAEAAHQRAQQQLAAESDRLAALQVGSSAGPSVWAGSPAAVAAAVIQDIAQLLRQVVHMLPSSELLAALQPSQSRH